MTFSFIHGLTGNPVGDAIGVFLATIGFYVLCALVLVPRKKKILMLGILAGIGAKLAELLVNLLWNRPRPFVTNNFTPLIEQVADSSFPSGHATASFALAYVIYTSDKRLGAIAYTLATLIAFSRVFVGVHYVSDIVAGALLGTLVAWSVRKLYK